MSGDPGIMDGCSLPLVTCRAGSPCQTLNLTLGGAILATQMSASLPDEGPEKTSWEERTEERREKGREMTAVCFPSSAVTETLQSHFPILPTSCPKTRCAG